MPTVTNTSSGTGSWTRRALQYYRVASGITISDIHFEEEGEIDGGRDGKTFQTQDVNIMDSPHDDYTSILRGGRRLLLTVVGGGADKEVMKVRPAGDD